ncbi:alpha/beta hydrolase, partial [Staphylococcus haemolyticus]|nr:alpha/beta hydrolase [Staphylococcus haemolyticus]
MSEQPSYYSIITANVRYDNRLTDSEKLLFAEITSLSNKYGYCTA